MTKTMQRVMSMLDSFCDHREISRNAVACSELKYRRVGNSDTPDRIGVISRMNVMLHPWRYPPYTRKEEIHAINSILEYQRDNRTPLINDLWTWLFFQEGRTNDNWLYDALSSDSVISDQKITKLNRDTSDNFNTFYLMRRNRIWFMANDQIHSGGTYNGIYYQKIYFSFTKPNDDGMNNDECGV